MVETKAERGVMISDQILLKQYADQVERLKAQIREREEGQSGNDATQVQARMDELLNANQQVRLPHRHTLRLILIGTSRRKMS